MCEKCDAITPELLTELESRVQTIELNIAEITAVITMATFLYETMGITDLSLASATLKLADALDADREAWQRGDWPSEITETEQ